MEPSKGDIGGIEKDEGCTDDVAEILNSRSNNAGCS